MTRPTRSWLFAVPAGALCLGLALNAGCGDGTPGGGNNDGGTTQDSGTAQDSGTTNTFIACPTLNEGCGTGGEAYTDRTGAGDLRTIAFGTRSDGGYYYEPKCMQVKAGQTVTFSGEFINHNMAQRCGPVDAGMRVTSGNMKTFTLTRSGDYGYYCVFHEGYGMTGGIRVVP